MELQRSVYRERNLEIWNRKCDSDLYKPYSETVKGRKGCKGEESTENKHKKTATWSKIGGKGLIVVQCNEHFLLFDDVKTMTYITG